MKKSTHIAFVHRLLFIVLLLLQPLLVVHSLTCSGISNEKIYRGADTLLVYQANPLSKATLLEDTVWRFTQVSASIPQSLAYVVSDSGLCMFSKHFLRANYHYQVIDDTLYCIGYETANKVIRYSIPEKRRAVRISQHDSLCTYFEACGEYGHRLPITLRGHVRTRCETIGTLVLPEMVIDSVFLFHTHRCYIEIDDDTTDVSVDLYQWFYRDYLYPIAEQVFYHLQHISDSADYIYAYYLPIEHHSLLPDKVEPTLIEPTNAYKTISSGSLTSIRCAPNPVYDHLVVSYELSSEAKVYYSLHYDGGEAFYQSPIRYQESGNHTQVLDMSGYPAGIYVLYVYANDTILSQNIIKL